MKTKEEILLQINFYESCRDDCFDKSIDLSLSRSDMEFFDQRRKIYNEMIIALKWVLS